MLSNVDIIRELGKNIEIYPLKEECIKGSSVNLTASNMAWHVSTKNTAVDCSKNEIVISSHDTSLILTEEIFAVSNRIAGTFHSRVADVSIGEGHISTVINPGWCGRPLIAVSNHTDEEIRIKIGSQFVIMVLDYLHSPSSIKIDSTKSSRLDVLHNYALTNGEKDLIFEKDINNWDRLHSYNKEKNVYANIKKSKSKKVNISVLIQIVIFLISCIFIWKLSLNNQDKTIPTILATAMFASLMKTFFDK